jgi:hypothetical protein
VDDASERPGDHLPWVRDNDRMPGRAASTYVRIPVEIAKDRPPPEAGLGNEVAETAPSVLPDTPTTARGAGVRRRSLRESARQADEPRRIDLGPRVFPGLLLAAALPGLLALLGLFLASLALATAAAMAPPPMTARFAAALVAAVLLGLLAYPAGRWALALSGFHPFRLESLEGLTLVRSATLEAVDRRAELQSLALGRSDGGELIRAREALGRYLASHPLGNRSDRRLWPGLGISGDTLEGLERHKDELLDPGRPGTEEGGDPGEWLRSFEEGFLAPLDVAARRRVEEHAWRTFKATAASPNGCVDALVTLSSGSSMLADLGRLYDLRMGRVGGAVLLVRLLVDDDLACRTDRPDARCEAVIEPTTGKGGEIDELPPESRLRAVLERHPIPLVAAETEALLAKGALEFGLRAESGLRHYFLMRRLGARAIRLLRPLPRC